MTQYKSYTVTVEEVFECGTWASYWAWIGCLLTITKVVGNTEQDALARAQRWIDNHGLWKE